MTRAKIKVIQDETNPGSICFEVKVGEAATTAPSLIRALLEADYWLKGHDRHLTGLMC